MEENQMEIEIYENDILMYLAMFFEDEGIDDIRSAPQNVWTSAMHYIYKHVFRGTDKLKSKRLHKDSNGISTNHNSYNYELLSDLVDIYIFDMCLRYDKEVSYNGFSALTGIHRDTLYDWSRDTTKLSVVSCGLARKLRDFKEESLTGKLVSMKHPTGQAIILNKQFGYNAPGMGVGNTRRPELDDHDLMRLSGKKRMELCDNSPADPTE